MFGPLPVITKNNTSMFMSYASIGSIYKETGWDKLKVRREVKNLTLFYKIYNNLAPEYLSDLIPPSVSTF
jgi:hypothetical protein